MRISDQRIKMITGIVLLIHAVLLTTGVMINKPSFLIAFLNAGFALSVIIYWICRQARITQHIFEVREIVVLCFEVAVTGFAVFSMIADQGNIWLSIIQFIIFGVHFAAAALFMAFILFFKIKRLI
jgi:hypothetical protein